MQRAGAPLNAVTYNTMISACAKAGLYARAQKLHAEMQAAGVADDVFTLTGLITGVCVCVCVGGGGGGGGGGHARRSRWGRMLPVHKAVLHWTPYTACSPV